MTTRTKSDSAQQLAASAVNRRTGGQESGDLAPHRNDGLVSRRAETRLRHDDLDDRHLRRGEDIRAPPHDPPSTPPAVPPASEQTNNRDRAEEIAADERTKHRRQQPVQVLNQPVVSNSRGKGKKLYELLSPRVGGVQTVYCRSPWTVSVAAADAVHTIHHETTTTDAFCEVIYNVADDENADNGAGFRRMESDRNARAHLLRRRVAAVGAKLAAADTERGG